MSRKLHTEGQGRSGALLRAGTPQEGRHKALIGVSPFSRGNELWQLAAPPEHALLPPRILFIPLLCMPSRSLISPFCHPAPIQQQGKALALFLQQPLGDPRGFPRSSHIRIYPGTGASHSLSMGGGNALEVTPWHQSPSALCHSSE